jgi:formate-dependent nitrite reductase membrane component NrfD
MDSTSPGLVGNSFKMGYRFQRYWDTSMAIAFFSAEVGAGLFAASCIVGLTLGMIAGLVVVATLKPYFHLAHMGVPSKSWRALARPDRSWISRGVIGIGLLIGFGALHILDRQYGLLTDHGLRSTAGTAVQAVAIASALLVMCYQGMAMAHSESFALWANPMLPASSLAYASTAGMLLAGLLGVGRLGGTDLALIRSGAQLLLMLDLAVVAYLMLIARRKSKGGAFSVDLLLRGEYAGKFISLVVVLGLIVPALLVALMPAEPSVLWFSLASVSMLTGFLAFRILVFKAAVFEPIAHDIAGSIGLSLPR